MCIIHYYALKIERIPMYEKSAI